MALAASKAVLRVPRVQVSSSYAVSRPLGLATNKADADASSKDAIFTNLFQTVSRLAAQNPARVLVKESRYGGNLRRHGRRTTTLDTSEYDD